jgi:hypothetical protein
MAPTTARAQAMGARTRGAMTIRALNCLVGVS